MPFIKIRQGHEDHPLGYRNSQGFCPNPVHLLKMHADGPDGPNEVVGALPQTILNTFALRHQPPPKNSRKGLPQGNSELAPRSSEGIFSRRTSKRSWDPRKGKQPKSYPTVHHRDTIPSLRGSFAPYRRAIELRKFLACSVSGTAYR